MNKLKLFAALAVITTAITTLAVPTISNDPGNVQLNVWTRQRAAARAKAAELGRPMLVFLGDSVTCSKCKAWDSGTVMTQAFADYLAANPMILIWNDRSWNGGSEWTAAKNDFGQTMGFGFPLILIYSPTGAQLMRFESVRPLDKVAAFTAKINPVVSQYPYAVGPGTIGFGVAGMSFSEDAGNITVTVKRTDGTAGAQSFSYATANGSAVAGAHYTARSGTLNWGNGDQADKTFTVPLIDDGSWNLPLVRVFTINLTKISGDATVGTAVLNVSISESTPYVPGLIGFTSTAGSVKEGTDYHGTVSRTAGAAGAASVTLTVNGGYTIAPTTLSWADGDSSSKAFTVSGIAATPAFDVRSATAIVTWASGAASIGQATHVITILDQDITQTFAQYIAGKPYYQNLVDVNNKWFYNGGIAALRTQPLNGGAVATLNWNAPGPGRLTFTWGSNGGGGTVGSFTITANGTTDTLTPPEETHTVGVGSGDVVVFKATGTSGDYVATLKNLSFEPLNPATAVGLSPANDAMIQISAINLNHSLVDLKWQAGAGNPGDKTQRLFAGASPSTLSDYGLVVIGVNAVTKGIVNLAAAQGKVYWRIDTELPGDFGRAVAPSAVWSFQVIDIPVFKPEAPGSGSSVNAFLRAGAGIAVGATSPTPVTYSAAGLPAGLAINATTGAISGNAGRAGSYPVTVTARNSEGQATRTFTVVVAPLPAYAKGKFQGFLVDASGDIAGTVAVSVSTTARITAKVVTATGTKSLRGVWDVGAGDGTFTTTLSARTGGNLVVELAPDGIMTGTLEGADLLARALNADSAAPFNGYYTVGLGAIALTTASVSIDNRPTGNGYLTLTSGRNGLVRYSGLLPDGTRMSGSSGFVVFQGFELSPLGYIPTSPGAPYAAVPFFKSLYGSRGMAGGVCWIDAQNVAIATDNLVLMDNSLWSYPGRSARAPDDGFTATFNFYNNTPFSATAHLSGGYYDRAPDLAALFNGGTFYVEEETYGVTATPTAVQIASNPHRATISINRRTGLYTGSLTSLVPGAGRTAIKGVILQGLRVGPGYYVLTDRSQPGYTVKRSYHVILYGP